MMYPETNFNYDSNNENKGNRKQRRQNKSRRNLHKAAAVLAGVAVIGGSFWGGSLLTQNTENTNLIFLICHKIVKMLFSKKI